ncbi:MAG: polysaccharide biosynthesis/export family protein [candidate division Zixibacteria bacterium]|nr:polysaccharide biosynthesis/export family protein [candidate division Zixibacteria bacterium]
MIKIFFFVLAGLIVITGSSTIADEYKVGQGDMLEISFWQDPSLNSQVRINQDGKISIDIVGEIQAAGKTTKQLETDIIRHISRVNKNISQAVVRVIQFNFQYVFVSGQVNDAGKKTFEEIPGLWSIINEAGGVTEIGDLSRVMIIHGGEGDNAGQVEIVNVRNAIATGTLNELPKISRMDTIEIPRTPIGLPSAELGQPPRERKNIVYVVGAVRQPGPITFEENVDVLEAISIAGGPIEQANLKETKVITKDGYYGQTIQLNLERYTKFGMPVRYKMRKEDVVVVPMKRSGWTGRVFNLTNVTALIGVISSTVLIMDRLSDDNEN